MPVVSGVGEAERSQHLHYYNCTTPNIILAGRRQRRKHLVSIANLELPRASEAGNLSYKHQIKWVIKAVKAVCMYWVQKEGIWDSIASDKD